MNMATIRLLLALLAITLLLQVANADTWARRAGVASGDCGANMVAMDSNGNIYVVGAFVNTINFQGGSIPDLVSSGDKDIFLAKYNAAGVPQWAVRAGGANQDECFGVTVDKIGNVFITGFFEGTIAFPGGSVANLSSNGTYDMFIAKYNAFGVPQWAQRGGGSRIGNTYITDIGYGVATDTSGNAYVTGHFDLMASFSGGGVGTLSAAGAEDIMIIKYNAAGVPQWVRRAGGVSNDRGFGIVADAEGNTYVTGYYSVAANFPGGSVSDISTSNTVPDIFIVKYSPAGVPQWAVSAGGGNQQANFGWGINLDNNNNLYVAGGFSTTASFPGGSVPSISSAGGQDIFLAKYTQSGIPQWARRVGGSADSEVGLGVGVDGNGKVYLSGTFSGTASIAGGSIADIVSAGNSDAFVIQYDASGVPQLAKTAGGSSIDRGRTMAVNAAGDVCVGGFFSATADFPGATSLTSSSSGMNAFIWKMCMAIPSVPANSALATPAAICVGDSVLLSSTGGMLGVDAQWAWRKGSCSGPLVGNGASIRIATASTTTYYVRAESPCDTSSCVSVTVTVNPKPDAAIIGATQVCNGQQYNYSLPSAANRAYSWSILGTNGTIITSSTTNPITVVWSNNTGSILNATLQVRERNTLTGCFHDTMIVVMIHPLPSPFITGDTSVCPGTMYTYRVPVIVGRSYQWSVSTEGVIAGSTTRDSVIVVWNNPSSSARSGRLQVRESIDGVGCSKDTSFIVNIFPPILPQASSDEAICLYSEVQISTAASGGTGNYRYSWSPKAGILSNDTLASIRVAPLETTTYIVTVTDGKGCQGMDTVVVRINFSPELYAGENKVICKGEGQTIGNDAIGTGGYIYEWTPAQGLNSTNVSRPFASPDTTTTYTVIVSDANGCKDTANVEVRVRNYAIALSRGSLDFGTLGACESSNDISLWITNNGEEDVRIARYLAPSGFAVVSSLPVVVKKKDSVQITIRYAPVNSGSSAGKVSLIEEPCNNKYEVDVKGTRLSVLYVADKSTIDFGTTLACNNALEADSVITIRNNGTEVMRITGALIRSPFSVVAPTTFPQDIAPNGGEIRITVRYRPTTAGQYNSELLLPFTAGSCSSEVTINLRALHTLPAMSVTPASIVFPAIQGCEPPRDTIITIENTGIVEIELRDIQSSDSQFQILSTLPIKIAAGESRQIRVRCNPTMNGKHSADMSILTMPCSLQHIVHLEGSKDGISFDIPDTVDMGVITSCSQSNISTTVNITNSSGGGVNGVVSAVQSSSHIGSSIKAGDVLVNGVPTPMTITYTPDTSVPFGSVQETIQIVLNPCGISKTIIVKAVHANVAISTAAQIDYGVVLTGTTRTQTVAYINSGLVPCTIDSINGIASPFSLKSTIPPLPAILRVGDTLKVDIEFSAQSGIFTEQIEAVVTKPCAQQIRTELKAEGNNSPVWRIESEPLSIDFDSVCKNVNKSIAVQVVNKGNQDVRLLRAEWKSNPGNVFRTTLNSQILTPGSRISQQIEFSPTAAQNYSAVVQWISDHDTAETGISGIGADCQYRTVVRLRNITAKPGTPVMLDLYLDGEPQQGWNSLPTDFLARVRFNKNILWLSNSALQCETLVHDDCTLLLQGVRKDSNLVMLPCITTLGNTDAAPLHIEEFHWMNNSTSDTLPRQDGILRITDVCEEGGVRLFTPTSVHLSLTSRPVPATNILHIEYGLVEDSDVHLELLSSNGAMIQTWVNNLRQVAGTYLNTEDISSLADGAYFLRLRTQNYILQSPLLIAR